MNFTKYIGKNRLNKRIVKLSKKIAKKILSKILEYLDKIEPNFDHRIAYISKSAIPQEETGILRINDGSNWVDKAVWVGVKNEFYKDVVKLIKKEDDIG